MKRYATLLFLLGVIFFLCIGWADHPDAIKKASQDISSIQANFKQEKYLKILSSPLISIGRFYFQKPKSFRWEYISPVQSILLMHHDKIKRYIHSSGQLIEDAGVNIQGMQMIIQEILMWLKGNFDNPIFEMKIENASKAILIPKDPSFSKMICRIELIFSKTPGIIEMISIYETETDYTKFTFTDTIVNVKIEDAIFEKIP